MLTLGLCEATGPLRTANNAFYAHTTVIMRNASLKPSLWSIFSPGIFPRRSGALLWPQQIRPSTKRTSGAGRNTADSAGRRLGAKCGDGQFVRSGTILMRQRGTKWFNGENAGLGRDHTIFALRDGYVRFYREGLKRKYVGIVFNRETRLPKPWHVPYERKVSGQLVLSSFGSKSCFKQRKEELALRKDKIKDLQKQE